MNSLLNPDNPVMQFITKIVTSVYLNILWFVCSIPIFTDCTLLCHRKNGEKRRRKRYIRFLPFL